MHYRYSKICLIHRHFPTPQLQGVQTKVLRDLDSNLMLGLSLFSLLSHTSTPQGNALLRQWFLSPLQSVDEIRNRQDAIAFFLEPDVQDAVTSIRQFLKKAGDVQTGLKGIRRGGIYFGSLLVNCRAPQDGGQERKWCF